MFDEKDEPDAENVSLELINSLKEYREIKTQNIETENYYVFPMYIRPDITLLGYINKNREQNTKSYIIFAFLLAFGANKVAKAYNKLAKFEVWAQRITGAVFLIIGIGMTFTITLGIKLW